MRMSRLKIILITPVVLFVVAYGIAAVKIAAQDQLVDPLKKPAAGYKQVAIFGASGTAGDGILKAALANPEIEKIHVVTRRSTPRIEAGVAAGKVEMTTHMDYLDYRAIEQQIAEVQAVYWAIGISAVGVDEETYGIIHVDFPLQFVREWSVASDALNRSFHYISSSDISADSTAMWAREKFRAEQTLIEFAAGTSLRVIAYRPDYIGPTDEEAHIGQRLLYWFFAPVGVAVRAEQIGQAMFEVTAQGDEFGNGDKLSTRKIILYSNSYEKRRELIRLN